MPLECQTAASSIISSILPHCRKLLYDLCGIKWAYWYLNRLEFSNHKIIWNQIQARNSHSAHTVACQGLSQNDFWNHHYSYLLRRNARSGRGWWHAPLTCVPQDTTHCRHKEPQRIWVCGWRSERQLLTNWTSSANMQQLVAQWVTELWQNAGFPASELRTVPVPVAALEMKQKQLDWQEGDRECIHGGQASIHSTPDAIIAISVSWNRMGQHNWRKRHAANDWWYSMIFPWHIEVLWVCMIAFSLPEFARTQLLQWNLLGRCLAAQLILTSGSGVWTFASKNAEAHWRSL